MGTLSSPHWPVIISVGAQTDRFPNGGSLCRFDFFIALTGYSYIPFKMHLQIEKHKIIVNSFQLEYITFWKVLRRPWPNQTLISRKNHLVTGVRWLGIVYLVILKDLKPSNVSKISFNCNESNNNFYIYSIRPIAWKITHFVFSLYIFS